MPYELSKKEIVRNVARNLIGYYWLGWLDHTDTFVRKYIGRADKRRLRERLLDQLKRKGGRHTHFEFFPTLSILEAYRMECRGYHFAVNLDNKIHPDAPDGLCYRCPYCLTVPVGHKAPATSMEVID